MAGFITKLLSPSNLAASVAKWVKFPDDVDAPVHGSIALDPATGLSLDVDAPVRVKRMDSALINNSLSATGNLFSVDMTDYNSISFDLTGTWVATITFEGSEDNVNWRSVLGLQPTTASTQMSPTATSPGMWILKRTSRYMRARISSYTSGTVVIAGSQRQTEYQDFINGNVKLIPANTQSGVPFGSRIQSAATTNATNLRTVSSVLNHLMLTNNGAAIAYIKFYNKASSPTVGTDTPLFTIALPANGLPVFIAFPTGIGFSTGLSYAITAGAADTDVAAVAANQVTGTIGWS